MHVIAATAVALKEAMTNGFKDYQKKVVANAKKIASELMARGYKIVSGGTDNHLFLVDLSDKNITGKDAEEALDRAGITLNKNSIPYDERTPAITSGIRIGTPCVTTRGMGEEEMVNIAEMLHEVLSNVGDSQVIEKIRQEVKQLCLKFPIRYDYAVC
jgi:glycine hydroxymethyltransferase